MQRTSAVSKTERIARTGWVGGFTVSSGIKKIAAWNMVRMY